jgi:hypothetical protein
VLCDGKHGKRLARFGEWLRRAADLEHWASFGKSFQRLGELIATVGRRDTAPATICVLSGDVHHAYIAEAHIGTHMRSKVYQLTCSPLHNYVPAFMKLAFRVFWSKFVERTLRILLGVVAKVPPVTVSWTRLEGPYFGNELAEFIAHGRAADTVLREAAKSTDDKELREIARVRLSA